MAPLPRTRTPAGPSARKASLDRGAVTVELALALPVLATVLFAALWSVGVAGSAVACSDSARAGARAAARGESPAAVAALVRSIAPPGASVTTSSEAGTVSVRVLARSRGRGLLHLAAITVQSLAVARLESASPLPVAR